VKLRHGLGLLAILGALTVFGCGGDEPSPSQDSTASGGAEVSQGRTEMPQGSAEGQKGSPAAGGSGSSSGSGLGPVVESPTPRQLGIREGYDNSIQTFGSQAGGRERDSAILAMRGLFELIAEGDLETACSAYFSSDYVETLVGLAESAGVQTGDRPCATAARVLAETTEEEALTAEARKALGATVLRVGVTGRDAILTLRTRQDVLAYFPMQREGGEWKATAFAIAPLRPAP
jgi:hypothetical protein